MCVVEGRSGDDSDRDCHYERLKTIDVLELLTEGFPMHGQIMLKLNLATGGQITEKNLAMYSQMFTLRDCKCAPGVSHFELQMQE